MGSNLLQKLEKFGTISLSELSERARFLKRIERKFLLTEEKFLEVLEDFGENFDILEIDDKRVFGYDNIYMDTSKYDFYWQHENGDSNRTKVRSRKYMDCEDLTFFEYKNKVDGVTHKTRYQVPSSEHGEMCEAKKGFFNGIFTKVYATDAPTIFPSLKTAYKRCTFVDKQSRERLTIDFHIETQDLRNPMAQSIRMENLVIIESKSMSDTFPSLEVLERHDISGAHSCSKYSLGIVYAGLAEKWSRFEKTISQIQDIRKEYLNKKRMYSQRSAAYTPQRFQKSPIQISLENV